MSEKVNVWKWETAAGASAAVLVLTPLVMAPPFAHFLRCRVLGCEITADHEYQQIWDWIVSMGAVTDWLLVAVGILQWRVYTQQAVILTRQTEISERQQVSLTRLERAYVTVRVVDTGFSMVEGRAWTEPDYLQKGNLRLSFENLGKTPAHLTHIEFEIRGEKRGGIPAPIDPIKVRGRELPSGISIAVHVPHVETENMFAKFIGQSSNAIISHVTTVWVTGFVRYKDVFGQCYIHGFNMALDFSANIFVRRGNNEDYNYDRAERAEDIPAETIHDTATAWPPA